MNSSNRSKRITSRLLLLLTLIVGGGLVSYISGQLTPNSPIALFAMFSIGLYWGSNLYFGNGNSTGKNLFRFAACQCAILTIISFKLQWDMDGNINKLPSISVPILFVFLPALFVWLARKSEIGTDLCDSTTTGA